MKKILLIGCLALMITETYAVDETKSDRWSYDFKIRHETDKERSSGASNDYTDLAALIQANDNESGMWYRYELLTSKITKDGSERDRHNFRIGRKNMINFLGFTITPYYQFRYENHDAGSVEERFQHRLGYSGSNDHGFSFWGYSSYDRFNGRASAGRENIHGYYGEHEILYSKDLGNGALIPSVYSEYMSRDDSSANNLQARLAYAYPVAEGFTLAPFVEADLFRRNTTRKNKYDFVPSTGNARNTGTNDDDYVYTFGFRGFSKMSDSWSAWGELSHSWIESSDDGVYIETGLAYRF